ncbi:MAG: FIST N-terminal domain-containing protein [Acidimicrobiales bacterium]
MPFAAALSEHPLATHAAGEVIGQILDRIGAEPDLAVLFVTAPHAGALDDIATAITTLLRPHNLIGATAVSVLAGDREAEETAAVSLWAGRLDGQITGVRLTTAPTDDGYVVEGLPEIAALQARSLLLIADPFSFPVDAFLDSLGASHPDLAVVGGLASAARGPGGNRLLIDGRVHSNGAVGVLLDADIAPTSLVSQGCRPIGDPLIVTRAEQNVIFELAGRPALDRLISLVESLGPEDRALAARGLHCGLVIDERQETFTRGDFLIRGVVGADREHGAVAIGDTVAVGTTIQFHVRDAESADDDLHSLLGALERRFDAALVFTCNGRGTHLFGLPHHDAAAVSEHAAPGAAVAGMFCAGELGPVGGRNFLHGFTASIALFRDRTVGSGP